MLTVYNCGQGDASVLYCPFCCKRPLVIDLGPQNFNYPSNIEGDIDLLITHSHSDHAGGSFNGKVKIKTLYVPAYYLEIKKIIQQLNKSNQHILKNKQVERIEILYEGVKFENCKHTNILNPPLNLSKIFDKEYIRIVEEITNEQVDEFLRSHETSIKGILEDKILVGSNESDTPDIKIPDGYLTKEFVYLALKIIIRYMNNNRTNEYKIRKRSISINKAINNFLRYDANKFSIVSLHDYSVTDHMYNEDNRIKYNNYYGGYNYYWDDNYYNYYYYDDYDDHYYYYDDYDDNYDYYNYYHYYHYYHKDNYSSILMTGDADISVFYRLIKKYFIKAHILKIPHHGSKESINYEVLKEISPKVAIISHNNRLFGKTKDSHPNIEVINTLKRLEIKAYYTNDVIKNGKVTVKAYKSWLYRRLVRIIQKKKS